MSQNGLARASINIPAPLRSFTDGEKTVQVVGSSVRDALDDLTTRFPKLKEHLFENGEALRSFVNIYVNDEDIRYLDDIETALRPDDELSIVPSIAGGSPDVAEDEVVLTGDELKRYHRHLLLPEVGLEGQKRLKAASVLLVGAGGLGSPLALYLAAAGVGRIGLVDFDVVDESNLHRQILHGTKDVGRSKLASAADRIRDVNPFVNLDLHETRLTSENALGVISGYDVVADGTDNFPTRYLVNDACVMTGTPNAYASIFRFDGQVSVFGTPDGPCYRCLYPEPPPPGLVPSCAEGGVLGILPGLVGTLQANEVVKQIVGIGDPLVGKLLLVDALATTFRTLKVRKNPDCPVCGDTPSVTELIDYDAFCGIPAASEAEEDESRVPEMSVRELSSRIRSNERPFILDVRKPFEDEIASLNADQLIPVEELAERMQEIAVDRDREIVVHCRTGVRSATAVALLREAGYMRAVNLKGGIRAWSEEIDPSVPAY